MTAERTPADSLPSAPATLLRLQKTAGNAAVSSLVRSVQREEKTPAVKLDGAEFSYPLNQVIPVNARIPKSPVKLKQIALSTSVKAKLASAGKAEEGNAPSVGTSGKFGGDKKFEAGVSGELRTLATGHAEMLKQKFKADAKMEYAVAGSPGELKTGMALTGGIQDESLKGTALENLKLGGELSLFEVNWTQKTGRIPEVSAAKLALSVSYDTPPSEHVLANGQKVAVTYKGSATFEFEPDWEQIVPWVIEQIGPETLLEAAGPYAFVAAGAAVMYYTFKDMDRQEKLAATVRAAATQIVRSGSVYASVLSGRKVTPAGARETEAFNAATADLEKLAKSRNIDAQIYQGLMAVPEYASPLRDRTGEAYVTRALGSLESQVDREIDAWHSEHYIQTFLSGRYASADKAMINAIVSDAQANPDGTIG